MHKIPKAGAETLAAPRPRFVYLDCYIQMRFPLVPLYLASHTGTFVTSPSGHLDPCGQTLVANAAIVA